MKKYIINCFLLATLFVVGCKKNDARYPFTVALTRVPYANVIIDPTSSGAIDLTNITSFAGKFNITLLYPTDAPPSKVDVVIIKNGVNSSVKILQAGVTTFPSTTITISAAQIASLFGTPIALGDNYDVGVDIYTQDGTKYEAFPTTGTSNLLAYSGTGQSNQPGFVPSIRFSAICAYDPNVYQGNFVVSDPDWQDFSPGDVIVLTKIDATHFSWVDPFVRNPVPVVVTVNPKTNVVSIPKQTIGTSWTYSANPATYPNPFVQTGTGTNIVSPCDKSVTFAMQYGFGGSQWSGTYLLLFRKQ